MNHDHTDHTAETMPRRAALGARGLGGLGAVGLAGAASADDHMNGRGGRGGRGGGEGGGGGGLIELASLGWDDGRGEYVLPPLPYDYDALEPHIDEQTMRIHHDRHHAGYVRGANTALGKLREMGQGGDARDVEYWTRELTFNGSGHVNHTIFWHTMAPKSAGGGGEPRGALRRAVERDFGSFGAMKTLLSRTAATVEGSGWGWLAYEPIAGRLVVVPMEKQQNLLMTGVVPLLGVDVWEHAYYLKYQNKRGEYLDNWFQVINWPAVTRLFERAQRVG